MTSRQLRTLLQLYVVPGCELPMCVLDAGVVRQLGRHDEVLRFRSSGKVQLTIRGEMVAKAALAAARKTARRWR